MKKIPTLFVRDPQDRKHVLNEITPGCEWVIDGEGLPTRKFDGTCVMLNMQGQWWTRREVKDGKSAPPGYWAEQYDEVTGKTVGWEPAEGSSFAKYLREAVDNMPWHWSVLRTVSCWVPISGTYELCGPKINANPEGYTQHVLVPHGQEIISGLPRDFEGLAGWLRESDFEGIVWHHPDGRMTKLKKRDFE